jgi:hypothetical protein
MVEQQTTIRLTISPNLRDAVATVAQFADQVVSPVVIAVANARTGEPGGVAEIVLSSVRSFANPGVDIEIVTPPALARLTWQRVRFRRDPSAEVDLRVRGGQLASVRILREVAHAGTVVAVNDLRGENDVRPTIAIGIWGNYTDLRDRFGLRLSAADKGAAAEVALAVQPSLIVLVDQWRGYFVALATTDQIAAELAGLAIIHVMRGDAEEPIGPWEDPLVQRATELHLGVLLPDLIAVRGIVARGADWVSQETVALLAEQIALKLGVADVGIQASSR